MSTATATVEVLTAEVRVLMVGSRQVTLSVYRQLDEVDPSKCEPFGRVCDKQDTPRWRQVFVVGVDADGALVRSSVEPWGRPSVYVEEGLILTPQPVWASEAGRFVDGPWEAQGSGSTTVDGVPVSWGDGSRQRTKGRFASADAEAEVKAEVAEEVELHRAHAERLEGWKALPLIVLAGLR